MGQIEHGRPGIANFDARWNAKVTPTEAFQLDGNPIKNAAGLVEGPHATGVAGIIVKAGEDNGGMATGAKLYSSGLSNGVNDPADWQIVRTFQFIAGKNNDDIVAINHSAGRSLNMGEKFDGSSLYTRGVDFVAAKHDTLVVLSGINDTKAAVYPRDGYNVLTVRAVFDALVPAGEEINGEKIIPRRVNPDSTNLVTDDPVASQRTLTHLVAPGPNIVATTGANGQANDRKITPSDSMAAPLATGTIALLQEHARKANSGLGADAKQDEVMKSVLINSADKVFGLLDGMTRTVLGKDGKSTWVQSAAADTPQGGAANPYDPTNPGNIARQALPLDVEMGAGFLNADRALRQLKGGQYAPNMDAGRIGWDYRSLARGAADPNPTKNVYKLPELRGGSYISATLTWDRDVTWTDSNSNGKYDENEPLAAQPLANMDLYLVERGETALTKAKWASNSVQYNVEHFFFQLPQGNKQYDLLVVQKSVAATNYGLAWWAEKPMAQPPSPPSPPSPPPPSAEADIEGQAWVDDNGNGTREPGLGETGLPHVWVDLLDDSNQVIDSVTTDTAGAYQFENLIPGDYTVRFATPARGAVTAQDVYDPQQGADDSNDSDIGSLGTVSVHINQSDVVNVDAGYTFDNAPPIGVEDDYTASHNDDLTVSAEDGVLANDSDPENDPLTAELFRAPDFGTLDFSEDGSFTFSFSPTTGFSGPVTFEYRPVDSAGVGDPVTVTIQIANNAPVAVNDTATTNEDTAVSVAVLANDTDADSDTLTVVSVDQGVHGAVTFTSSGVTYTPDANWHGTDSSIYRIDDGFGGVAEATLTVTVNPGNDAPDAVDDDAGTMEPGSPVSIAVLANDTDPDGDTLTVIAVTQGTYGWVTFTATGVTYHPPGFGHLEDAFTYTISDGHGGTDTATVHVNGVTPIIIGHIWDDGDDDGIQDEDEPGNIDGIVVQLLDEDDNVIDTTTTDSDGRYYFWNIDPGQYRIRFIWPGGGGGNLPHYGSGPDSDVDQFGYSALLTVVPGSLFNIDAGLLGLTDEEPPIGGDN